MTDRVSAEFGWWPLHGAFPAIFLSMLSNGLQSSILGIRARSEGFDTLHIGLVMSGIYVGLLSGSLMVPRIIAILGHRAVYVAAAVVFVVTMPLFQITHSPSAWFLLRVVLGVSLSGIYVANESWISVSSSGTGRAGALARYMAVVYAGLIAGQLVLPLLNPTDFLALVAPAVFMCVSLLTNRRLRRHDPPAIHKSRLSLGRLFILSPLGALGCIAYGMAQGAYFGMGPTVSNAAGYSVRATAGFMIAGSLGAVLAQTYSGTLSLRWGRHRLIVLTAVAGALAALAIGAGFRSSPMTAIVLTVFWGSFSMPIYALILAETNDRVDQGDRVALSGHFLLLFGLGAILGPAVTGLLVHRFGSTAMFWILSLINVGIVLVASVDRYFANNRPPTQGCCQHA